jgi:adenine-specific DNA-methyltransferase
LTQEELSIIKPWYKNSDIKKWFVNLTPKGFLININYSDRPDMSLYPNLYAHFSKYRTVLENRPQTGTLQSAFKNGYWYVLTTSRKLNFSGPKIVVPQRSPSNNFGYTELPWFAASDVYFITAKDQKYPLKFLLGLLNSKLFYFWLYFRGKRKGEILELFGTPLSEIPIRIVEKNKQEEIISLVNMILDYGPNSGSTNIERVKLIEKELNNKVYELYKLDPSEINLVESIAK